MAACAFGVHFAVVAILLCSSQRVHSAGDVVNIAASATCTASIDCQPKDDQCTSCENAIDGNRYSTSWRYVGAAVGVWLQIVFDKTYDVSSLLIAQPYWADERHFKDIKLTFSDGSEHMVTLANRTDGYNVVETFASTPPRLSSSIKLSVVSAYDVSSKTHALNEVEVYGSIPDESTSVKIQTTATTTGVQSSPTKTTTTSPTTTTTSPTTTTTPPTTTTTTHSTTSTTALTSTTTLPTSTTTLPTTTTTPPTTSTTITDTPPSAFVTTAENNVTTDTDPPRSKNLWTGRYLYIAIGVVAALLIIVVCVVVSSRRGKSSKNIEEEVYDTIA